MEDKLLKDRIDSSIAKLSKSKSKKKMVFENIKDHLVDIKSYIDQSLSSK